MRDPGRGIRLQCASDGDSQPSRIEPRENFPERLSLNFRERKAGSRGHPGIPMDDAFILIEDNYAAIERIKNRELLGGTTSRHEASSRGGRQSRALYTHQRAA